LGGKSALTDRNIILVYLTFGVNETWLRTGTGEMFAKDKEYTNDEQEILSIFRRLPPESRDAFLLVGQGLLLKNQQALKASQPGEKPETDPSPDFPLEPRCPAASTDYEEDKTAG
jgi:hypothetical protein